LFHAENNNAGIFFQEIHDLAASESAVDVSNDDKRENVNITVLFRGPHSKFPLWRSKSMHFSIPSFPGWLELVDVAALRSHHKIDRHRYFSKEHHKTCREP